MPYPQGIVWEDQGIPALSVPYGIARDFFYSGHTGFMLMSFTIWSEAKFKVMKWLMFVGIFQVIYLLIVTRVHYTIDIFGGAVFCRSFILITRQNQKEIDEFISLTILNLWGKIKSFFNGGNINDL